MRVLVLSALLACVSAAPSHLAPIGLVALPIALPVPSGDLQAAVIDAQVKINDQAQEIVDQARARSDLAVQNQNEGVLEANDLVKEKSEEAFWAAEEKKWQELNAAQVAAAKLDASLASSMGAYKQDQVIAPAASDAVMNAAAGEEKVDAKTAGGFAVKSAEAEVKSEAISESKNEDKESVEIAADVKSADVNAESGMSAEMKKEGIIPDIQKFGLALQALKTVYPAPVALAPSLIPPIAYSAYKSVPLAAVPYPGQFYSPTGSLFIKHAW